MLLLRRSALAFVALALAAGLPRATAQEALPYLPEAVFPEAVIASPVDLQHDNADPARIYVVEQTGRILALDKTGDGSDATPFLDIRDRVLGGGELGLLGLAFHPDYAANGRLFVYYTAPSPTRSIVAEYARSATDPGLADPASERVLLTVVQPFSNHNAGQLAFGPDGYLYVALGDGGAAGDPEENGEDPTTLLGALLRLDVDDVPPGQPYGIPEDNPFAPTDGLERDEIFAYGLRNPWRFSFDPATGDLWAADVGQNAFEEVNRIVNGGDYGWDRTEGFACYEPRTACDRAGTIDPVFAYPHGTSTGRSVTGGYVYRGPTLTDLTGQYVYGDYVSGNVWALDASDARAPVNTRIARVPSPTSFGTDAEGELYVLSSPFGEPRGQVFRFVRTPVATEDDARPAQALALDVAGANPFRDGVTLRARAATAGPATLHVYDLLGRVVATLLDTDVQPGQVYEVRFDAGDLPPGLYLAHLRAGGLSETRRLVRAR